MRIDDNYTANSDTYGWTLTFSEERERTKKDKSKEIYMFEEHTYHSSLKNCLKKYLDLTMKGLGDVEEVLERIQSVEKKIDELKL